MDPNSPHLSYEDRRRFYLVLDFIEIAKPKLRLEGGVESRRQGTVTSNPLTPNTPKSMQREDKVFYTLSAIFAAVFTAGLFALFEGHTFYAILFIVGGLVGMASTVYESKQSRLLMTGITMMALTWAFLGYDLYDRHYNNATVPSSASRTPSDSRDPTPREADVIRDLAVKGSFKVAVYCLMTERDSCHYAKEWLRVLNTAGWKTSGLIETDYEEPNNGLIVCARLHSSANESLGKGEFGLALRENSIPVSDDCRDPDLAKDTTFDLALLVGGP